MARATRSLVAALLALAFAVQPALARTNKPPLHGHHWVAVTGKPLAAVAGAKTFERGGNAVDAACAMLAATATMWDVLSWGGETQALIFDPRTQRVIGVNAHGVAGSDATVAHFRKQGLAYPPATGGEAAVTPGTPGGLLIMLAEYGRLSLAEVLWPALELARGYPIDAETANALERDRALLASWPDSKRVLLPHLDPSDASKRAAPAAGEIFRQPELAATLEKLIAAERDALAAGKSRRDAILAAYGRFYRGDIARELVAAARAQGALFTEQDLARWSVRIEEPVRTTYRGVDVYKLTTWTQGPAMLQALNLLEQKDLRALGHNSPDYLHAIYQAMNLAFADRDFYYGDPYHGPAEPIAGLLSKDYAKRRFGEIDWARNDPDVKPGDPYPFQGAKNPFARLLRSWPPRPAREADGAHGNPADRASLRAARERAFMAGTTSIQAADAEGWVVSVTPSGAWIPAVIAGRTGIGLSQRMQAFVLDPAMNPYNVLATGKLPRVTLTPTLALKDGKPWLAFSVQGGDTQDQNLLQFFLNVVEFGMTPQQAAEAPNLVSFQMFSSFGEHVSEPGRLVLRADTPVATLEAMRARGYQVETEAKTSGPITAILVDAEHGTLWGAASDFGEDTGIAW
ncbi:MAG: gamma-glutamyltransferase [Deltaproteobacteria bacterium]|nr:gamma-glutamyltransferase [Deltaproteobacteria bacterium]